MKNTQWKRILFWMPCNCNFQKKTVDGVVLDVSQKLLQRYTKKSTQLLSSCLVVQYMSRINRSCRMVRWVSEVSGGEVSTGDTTHSVVVPRSAENDNLF